MSQRFTTIAANIPAPGLFLARLDEVQEELLYYPRRRR